MKTRLLIMIFVFGLLGLTLFSFSNAYACTCVANMPIEQKVIANEIIFSGKLVEKNENPNNKEFIFEIDKLWKNHSDKILLEQKNITVFTSLQGSSCGTDFTVGLNYLVYSNMKGKLAHTSSCSGSGLLFLKILDITHFDENDIQGKAYYEKEHPLIPGSIAKMERDCRDGLLEKQGSPIRNGTHYYSKDSCQWLDKKGLIEPPTQYTGNGNGIGTWTGTSEGMEQQAIHIIGGVISTAYALGVWLVIIFPVVYFVAKRKNIPSKPYLPLIISGILLYYGTINFFTFNPRLPDFLYPDQDIQLELIGHLIFSFWIPIINYVIAGILLYRSSVIRKLIKK